MEGIEAVLDRKIAHMESEKQYRTHFQNKAGEATGVRKALCTACAGAAMLAAGSNLDMVKKTYPMFFGRPALVEIVQADAVDTLRDPKLPSTVVARFEEHGKEKLHEKKINQKFGIAVYISALLAALVINCYSAAKFSEYATMTKPRPE